jgi:hypothetical protein
MPAEFDLRKVRHTEFLFDVRPIRATMRTMKHL